MERVAFLIEDTGVRLSCLLNPNTLVIRRSAGVQQRQSAGGQLTGAGLSDDPLMHTGGGQTELELELLFDVMVSGSSIDTDDVRDLTRPLWELAENTAGDDGYGKVPRVRFVWGKAWNVPGVIATVSERFEQFTAAGEPQRSWLHMRLIRANEPVAGTYNAQTTDLDLPDIEELSAMADVPDTDTQLRFFEARGSGADVGGERLDVRSAEFWGDPAGWRPLAIFNDIDDPLRIAAGTILRVPPISFRRTV